MYDICDCVSVFCHLLLRLAWCVDAFSFSWGSILFTAGTSLRCLDFATKCRPKWSCCRMYIYEYRSFCTASFHSCICVACIPLVWYIPGSLSISIFLYYSSHERRAFALIRGVPPCSPGFTRVVAGLHCASVTLLCLAAENMKVIKVVSVDCAIVFLTISSFFHVYMKLWVQQMLHLVCIFIELVPHWQGRRCRLDLKFCSFLGSSWDSSCFSCISNDVGNLQANCF